MKWFHKTNRKNRIIVFLVILSLVLSLETVPGSTVHAEAYTEGYYTYTVNSYYKTAMLTAYSGSETEITIPSYVGDGAYVVTEISNNIFDGNSTLTKVNFMADSQLKVIGSYAFQNTGIQEIALPSTVSTIGVYAFKGCSNLQSVSLGKESKLSTIGIYAFANTAISNFVIPAGVEELPSSLFYQCTQLESVEFADNSVVNRICDSVFRGCTALKSICIPNTVTRIGQHAFSGCSTLGTVVFEQESVLDTIEMSAFESCTSLKEVEIPATVTSILGCVFMYCSSLEKLTFQEGSLLTKIGNYAVFETAVKEIVLPANVETLGTLIFYGSKNLTLLCYPSSIDSETMADAIGSTVKLPYTIAYTMDDEEETVSIEYTNVAEDTTEFVIPNEIGGMTVVGVAIEGVTMPKMPDSKMVVGNAVKTIADIELPEGWNFAEDDMATELVAGGEESFTITYLSDAFSMSREILVKREPCANLVIRDAKENSCKEDGYSGDTYCKDCSVKIESGKVIPKHDNHTWDAGVVTKEATALDAGERTYTCSVCGATKTEEVEALGMPASGADVSDPNGEASYKVTSSDASNATVEYAAPTNVNGEEITVPDTITVNGVTYQVTSIAKNAFKNNKKIKKIILGNNIKTIGDNAFSGCVNLKTVKLGKNVTTIGNKAFYNCKKLNAITIPTKVNKIGKQAFYKCSQLKKITIKTSKLTKKNVGNKAFGKINAKATIKVPKKKLKDYKALLKSKGVGSKVKIKK